jgi:hypothetical protein
MLKQIILSLFLLGTASAFVSPSTNSLSSSTTIHQNNQNSNNIFLQHNNNRLITTQSSSSTTSTALSERQWNFNNGRSPFGLKKNAEIWNGRVAQMAFIIVLLQELVTGKGVIAAYNDGDISAYVFLGVAAVSTVGLSAWLAIKGDESDVIF